ncbi:hypothetical protein [Asticcacaulis sp. EMRT-3]|uniref:hypothetical protein n=1 Tax=Asticcacaulis sp. EMRT-3 TaxID=3040349 RepID=UPI0024AE95DB|nr:hypothetical protein [Asticcacaulis sp. EMRT-3]MDI7774037.1 hypothetical protein [Asticcacaulis sp. EMRT-3]
MQKVIFDSEKLTVRDNEGNLHELFDHLMWYIAPTRTTWSRADIPKKPTEFAFALHNASIGQGLAALIHGSGKMMQRV